MGCSQVDSFQIEEPDLLLLPGQGTDVSCQGFDDGQIAVFPEGGTGPYSFLWSNGQTTDQITSLTPDNYSVTVTDNHGCSQTNDFDITEPEPLSTDYEVTEVDCYGQESGAINVDPSGGTGPYTFLWATGQDSAAIDDLAAGTYLVTITDAHNCSFEQSVDVMEPDAITASFDLMHNQCYGDEDGSIELSVEGGNGFVHLCLGQWR